MPRNSDRLVVTIRGEAVGIVVDGIRRAAWPNFSRVREPCRTGPVRASANERCERSKEVEHHGHKTL